jgi:hypothetical protein
MPVRSRPAPPPEQIGWPNTINFFGLKRGLEAELSMHHPFIGKEKKKFGVMRSEFLVFDLRTPNFVL